MIIILNEVIYVVPLQYFLIGIVVLNWSNTDYFYIDRAVKKTYIMI